MRLNDTAMQNPQALQWLLQRRSSRAFLPDAVPDDLLQQLLLAARRAPSGGNLQPGRLIAVQGRRRQQLTDALLQDFESQAPEQEDYAYFPAPCPCSCASARWRRRRPCTALSEWRDDRAGREAQFARNYRFFDAPVALVVTIDAHFGPGGYMDLGMTLYGLQLAAATMGLGSCAIGALASYPPPCAASWSCPNTSTSSAVWPGWADDAAPSTRPTPPAPRSPNGFRRLNKDSFQRSSTLGFQQFKTQNQQG